MQETTQEATAPAINIPMLLLEYEQRALEQLFGPSLNATQKGEQDGAGLHAAPKHKMEAAITATFAQLRQHMQHELAARLATLAEQKAVAAQRQRQCQTLRAELSLQHGGKYTEQRRRKELHMALRRLDTEEEQVLRTLSQDFLKRINEMQDTIMADLLNKRDFMQNTNVNYTHLANEMLFYGKPKTVPDADNAQTAAETGKSKGVLKGYYALLQARLDEMLQERLTQEERHHELKVKHVKKHFDLRREALKAPVIDAPSLKAAWFNTFITLLVFAVEIPLHLFITSRSLGMKIEKTPDVFLIIVIAIGLPLVLGLALKQPVEEWFQKNKRYAKNLLLFSVFMLVASIAILNGIRGEAGLNIERSITRVIFFVSATMVLSTVGAVYFTLAANAWKTRKMFAFKGKKTKDVEEKLMALQNEEDALTLDIQHAEIETAEIEDFLGIHSNEASLLHQQFQRMSQSALEHYNYGFSCGWRTALARLFKSRSPIPLTQN